MDNTGGSHYVSINLTVTELGNARRIPLKIPKDVTSSKLRELVADGTKIPLQCLRLIFCGRLIGNDNKKAVEEFKLEDDCVLHCMGKPEGYSESASQATAAGNARTTGGASAGPSVTINPSSIVPPPPTTGNPVLAAFDKLRSSNSPQTYLIAVTTLEKILTNIIANPMEEKYRKMRKGNAAFQKRLGGLVGGEDAMKAAGFSFETENDEEFYVIHASAEKWPELVAAKSTTESAVREAKAAANENNAPPSMPAASAMPAFGTSGGAGMMGPDMQRAAERMTSDPSALHAMLQNPTVQNTIRSDPRFSSNPMLQQSLEQLSNNPMMAQQLSQIMRDPNMQRQMQTMIGAGGEADAGFRGMAPLGATGASNNNGMGSGQRQGAPNNGASNDNDEDLTEEQMIAEAIRRSLEEGGS